MAKFWVDVDANLGRDIHTGRSHTGESHWYSGNLIHWETHKVDFVEVATGTTETIACYHGSQRGLSIQNMIGEHTSEVAQPTPIILRSDSTVAKLSIERPTLSWKLRHLRCKYFAVRDWARKKMIEIYTIPSKDNTADIFTKAVVFDILERLRSRFMKFGQMSAARFSKFRKMSKDTSST